MTYIIKRFRNLYNNRKLFLNLTFQDFKSKYFGSFLGTTWAFIQPTITIFVFWFVFQVGFRTQPISNVPFILWLLAGIIPWFYVSETLSRATHAFVENGFLVSKVAFKIGMLPFVRVTSGLLIHIFFIVVLMAILLFYDFMPSIYWLQIFYFLICAITVTTTLSLIFSTLYVFFKDISYIVGVIIQLGFWVTPIFWSKTIMPEKFLVYIKLNPFYYVIEGYRLTFLEKKWFWENDIYLTLYFWSFTIFTGVIGVALYKKLRPHFADVI
ncbi:ABC transporter permease [Lysinibacillus capsici]|uniref:ABC transporter permease n=1 Tax=Lysinibacillus capsici TaxID=2115968 RepID=UPI00273220BE|nr:ABC transporter permease [Lysinibacillus capsici]MDP1415310.1 ABC transporter permease [Lysinibacillus capsici]